jgi:hypothetical protein
MERYGVTIVSHKLCSGNRIKPPISVRLMNLPKQPEVIYVEEVKPLDNGGIFFNISIHDDHYDSMGRRLDSEIFYSIRPKD